MQQTRKYISFLIKYASLLIQTFLNSIASSAQKKNTNLNENYYDHID